MYRIWKEMQKGYWMVTVACILSLTALLSVLLAGDTAESWENFSSRPQAVVTAPADWSFETEEPLIIYEPTYPAVEMPPRSEHYTDMHVFDELEGDYIIIMLSSGEYYQIPGEHCVTYKKSPDHRSMVLESSDGRIWFFSPEGGRILNFSNLALSSVPDFFDFSYTADGSAVYLLGRNYDLSLLFHYDIQSNSLQRESIFSGIASINSLTISPDGRQYACLVEQTDMTDALYLYDRERKEWHRETENPFVKLVAVSNQANTLYGYLEDGSLASKNLNGAITRLIQPEEAPANKVYFNNQHNKVLYVVGDKVYTANFGQPRTLLCGGSELSLLVEKTELSSLENDIYSINRNGFNSMLVSEQDNTYVVVRDEEALLLQPRKMSRMESGVVYYRSETGSVVIFEMGQGQNYSTRVLIPAEEMKERYTEILYITEKLETYLLGRDSKVYYRNPLGEVWPVDVPGLLPEQLCFVHNISYQILGTELLMLEAEKGTLLQPGAKELIVQMAMEKTPVGLLVTVMEKSQYPDEYTFLQRFYVYHKEAAAEGLEIGCRPLR